MSGRVWPAVLVGVAAVAVALSWHAADPSLPALALRVFVRAYATADALGVVGGGPGSPEARATNLLASFTPPPHNLEKLIELQRSLSSVRLHPLQPEVRRQDVSIRMEDGFVNDAVLLTPSGAKLSDGLVFYVHGGGLVSGSVAMELPLAEEVAAQTNLPVLSVEYRKLPTHTLERLIGDVRGAYQYALSTLGVAPSRVRAFGASGGGMAVLLAMLSVLESGDAATLPACAATLYPSPGAEWIDGGAGEDWRRWESFATAVSDPQDGMLPPGFYDFVAQTIFADPATVGTMRRLLNQPSPAGLPDLLITTGGIEAIRTGTEGIARALTDRGARVDFRVHQHMPHAFQMFFHLAPEARESVRETARWLAACEPTAHRH